MQQLFSFINIFSSAYMFQATNSSILRSTFWLYTVKKCSWGWANLSPETCRPEL